MPGRRSVLVATASVALPRAALAQAAWPARPVRIVAPYSPGGQSDTIIRMLAPKMQEVLGQPIVIENRTGAGGTIGAGVVAQSPADGYTLLFESFAFVVAPLVAKGLTFNYETAFIPVAQAVALPYVLITKRDFPAPHDLAGFVAEAKRNPGITYGTPGIGSAGHLAGALLAYRAGIKLEHVAYRGGQDAARDVIAGNVDAAISTANSLRPLVDADKAWGIALTSAERRGSLARLPTISETYPGFDITSWNGLFAPAGTPAEVVTKLSEAMRAATSDPAIVQRLAQTGSDAVESSPAAFAERVAKDRETVKQIIAQTGLKLD